MIHVLSVRHTGTHIIRNILLKDHKLNKFHVPDTVLRTRPYIKQITGGLVVSPLRHPARVLESFKRRYDNVDRFYRQWQILIDIFHPFIGAYVHIDHPTRNRDLILMAEYLDIPSIEYDWTVNEDSGSRHNTHDMKIEDCEDVPQQFIDFYNETLVD